MTATANLPLRKPRGMAMVIVLSMVLLISASIAFAITVSNHDGAENGKQIHNLTSQNVTEGAMQKARSFFSLNAKKWDYYLAAGLTSPPDKTLYPELYLDPPSVPTGFSCYIYARDDADELPPAVNNPAHDNNHLIYIGAVCNGPANTNSEMSGVLQWDDSQFTYRSQYSGGTSGLNNTFTSTNVVSR